VRQAVDVAGAERIGHGADVTYENDPDQLLKDMAAKHVLVEINLSSNEDVLGMVGENHPLPIHRKSGVPVTLSTDDEGIERIDLTHEWRESVVQSRLRPACRVRARGTRPERSKYPKHARASSRKAKRPRSNGKLERRFAAFEAEF
jgi:adenosine deaminase